MVSIRCYKILTEIIKLSEHDHSFYQLLQNFG